MAEIYKDFNNDDIVAGDAQIISQPVWSENMNPYSQSFGGSTGIFQCQSSVTKHHRLAESPTAGAIL
mgnify:CR=1 FL=1